MTSVTLSRIVYLWRIAATGLCFASFGLSGLLFSALIAPAVWIFPTNNSWKRDTIHLIIHWGSRLFVWMLRTLGVMTLRIQGAEKLQNRGGWCG